MSFAWRKRQRSTSSGATISLCMIGLWLHLSAIAQCTDCERPHQPIKLKPLCLYVTIICYYLDHPIVKLIDPRAMCLGAMWFCQQVSAAAVLEMHYALMQSSLTYFIGWKNPKSQVLLILVLLLFKTEGSDLEKAQQCSKPGVPILLVVSHTVL